MEKADASRWLALEGQLPSFKGSESVFIMQSKKFRSLLLKSSETFGTSCILFYCFACLFQGVSKFLTEVNIFIGILVSLEAFEVNNPKTNNSILQKNYC